MKTIVPITKNYALYDGKDHLDIVNNLNLILGLVRKYWQNEDNYFMFEIVQRHKDNDKVLDDSGNSIFGKKKINGRINGAHNFIGYGVIQGKTREEACKSAMFPLICLYPEFAEMMGVNKKYYCGETPFENIIHICEFFNARAYLTPMKESITKVKEKCDKHEFWNEKWVSDNCKKYKDGDDWSSQLFRFAWNTEHAPGFSPWIFIDCDIPDIVAVYDIKDILSKKYGVPYDKILSLQSHNGYHILFDPKNIRNSDYKEGIDYKNTKTMDVFRKKLNKEFKLFGAYAEDVEVDDEELQKLTEQKDEGGAIKNNLVVVEKTRISMLLVYSSVGTPNKNIEHPDWNKGRTYPVNSGKQSVIYIPGVYKKPKSKTKKKELSA